MTVTYGKTTPTSYSDPEVLQINRATERLGDALRPGAYLVDAYPFLKYIPIFTSKLKGYHRDELALYRSQVAEVKERRVRIADPSQSCDHQLTVVDSPGKERRGPVFRDLLARTPRRIRFI